MAQYASGNYLNELDKPVSEKLFFLIEIINTKILIFSNVPSQTLGQAEEKSDSTSTLSEITADIFGLENTEANREYIDHLRRLAKVRNYMQFIENTDWMYDQDILGFKV